MRFLIRARVPRTLETKKLEDYMDKFKPEATYFLPIDGHRTAASIVNIESNNQVPALVEPLFQWMGANVDAIPVMNLDDLKNGLLIYSIF